MIEFYPDLVAFYQQPRATVKEMVQARIRGNLMAEANHKRKTQRVSENVAVFGILAIVAMPLIAYLAK